MKKVLFILAGFFLLIHFFSYSQQQSPFKIVSGIPYLPVYQNTGSVSSPVNGMFIFSLDDATPMIYNGSSWSDICSASLTTTSENYFVVKSGVPFMPAKTTIAGTPGSGDMYYSTTDNAIMVYNGSTWEKLRTIGRNNFSSTTGSSTDNTLKIIQIPVLSSAPGGISVGAIYINSTSNNFNYYTSSGWVSLSCPFICGEDLYVDHVVGTVSPESVTIAYKTVSSNITGSTKCWITQNLGAASQASSVSENSTTSRGWFWTFNVIQGHMVNATNVITPSAIDQNYGVNSAWIIANDPCTSLLGTGWRIPTNTEWTNADSNSGWTTAETAYSSILKIHMAGYLSVSLSGTGNTFTAGGSAGRYYSSTQVNNNNAYYLGTTSTTSAVANYYKYYAYTLRCLKD